MEISYGRCKAQVKEDWCDNQRIKNNDYCNKHSIMFDDPKSKPLFTAKHYKAIAKMLGKFFKGINWIGNIEYKKLDGFTCELEAFLTEDNPKFKSKEFWKLVYKS